MSQKMDSFHPVKSTSHISFDEGDKTFRLYAGNSIYAFCITPELTLEHLHWGPTVPKGYDLRYLSQSSRHTHFNTVEAAPENFGGKIILGAETLEEIQKTWRENKLWTTADVDDDELFQRKRLENYSWRIMTKIAKEKMRKNNLKKAFPNQSSSLSQLASYSLDDIDETKENPQPFQPQSPVVRRPPVRSMSQPNIQFPIDGNGNPIHYTPSESDFSRLREMYISKIPSERDIDKYHKAKFLDDMPTGIKSRNFHQHLSSKAYDRAIGKIGKGGICVEYADHGTGDFRPPSFMLVDNFNGSSISPLRYKRHRIYRGKLPMPDHMPSIRSVDDSEASTLVITLSDIISGVDVDLVYVCMHNYDVITRRTVFRNSDKRDRCSTVMMTSNSKEFECGSSKVILKASSATIDFEAESQPFHLVQLSGSWARERYVVETKLKHGTVSFGSMRGVSGHQHNPFAAICFGYPSETTGEVRAFSFIYSGNFLYEVDYGELGRLRVNVGIHPQGLQWNLQQGKIFATPEVVMARSSEGLGGISRTFHRLFLERLIPKNWSDESPPVLLNTWEAKYFHVNHDNVLDLAIHAAKIGIDMIVLDDGWFGKREDDHSSLGDWVVNLSKFPAGLYGLVKEINALGIKFGIWVEPEMVSENSALYTAHRDWYLHAPGRPRQMGRNQMVLDLSRQDVRDYLFNSISSLLKSANIEYLKWDMNRPLTEVYSIACSEQGGWQTEISHRYVLGLYELQDRIIKAFPNVLLENCASGGGRFDPGMLYYSPQIWCSDNTDALVRMKIQYGTSIVYPTRCIGAHISSVPNHMTGNSSRLRTRSFVAMCGTFGFELDITTSSAKDMLIFKKQIDIFKRMAPIIRFGDLYRLWDPFKVNFAAWMYVTRDKKQATVFAFSMNSDHWSSLVPRLILQGLDPEADYEISEPLPNNITQSSGTLMIIETEVPVYQLGISSTVLTGKIMMTAGLPIKFYTLDDSVMFELNKLDYRD